MSQSTMKPVRITNIISKEYIDFPGMRRAADYLKVSYPTMHAVIHKTKQKSTRGWSAEYLNEEDRIPNAYVKKLSTYTVNKLFTDNLKLKFVPAHTGICAKLENLSNYLFYDDGTVYSLKKGKFISPWKSSNGYMESILVNDDNVRVPVKIHRLIAYAFLNPIDGKPYINHIDGNKENNHYTNLEWCDREYNYIHAKNNKLIKTHQRIKCTNKITGIIKEFESRRQAAKILGIPQSTMALIHGNVKQKNSTNWFFEDIDD